MNVSTRHPGMFAAQARIALALSGLLLIVSPAHAQLLWSDEFDSGSRPNSAIWSYDLGATGWGNQELQEYTDSIDNARIENGDLVITARAQFTGSTPTGRPQRFVPAPMMSCASDPHSPLQSFPECLY